MKSPELTANQKRALIAILSNPTIELAAAECKLSERTLYNYLADETFKAELSRRQDDIVKSVSAALVGMASKSVKALADILDDPEATQAVKARVALGWLQQMRQTVELDDLAQRVARLESISESDAVRQG